MPVRLSLREGQRTTASRATRFDILLADGRWKGPLVEPVPYRATRGSRVTSRTAPGSLSTERDRDRRSRGPRCVLLRRRAGENPDARAPVLLRPARLCVQPRPATVGGTSGRSPSSPSSSRARSGVCRLSGAGSARGRGASSPPRRRRGSTTWSVLKTARLRGARALIVYIELRAPLGRGSRPCPGPRSARTAGRPSTTAAAISSPCTMRGIAPSLREERVRARNNRSSEDRITAGNDLFRNGSTTPPRLRSRHLRAPTGIG